MMMNNEANDYQAGDIVQAEVRSGRYVAELMEINGPRALVKVLAVLEHPEQGDLHQPYDPDVAMFHERRALSYTEKTTVLLRDLSLHAGEVPNYAESLRAAVTGSIQALDRLNRWTGKALESIRQLEKEYKL
jgi:kinase-associated protein B